MPDKAREVKEMFGAIAPRYDFLNHFLSLNIDRRWRRAFVREVSRRIALRDAAILDVGCGTGDLAIAFAELGPVVGGDFCSSMLRIAGVKAARARPVHPVTLVGGDALALPFADAAFDVVVSAFVLRNLASIPEGLAEMRRVLRPGGVLGIMDFSMPALPVLGRLYRLYFLKLLPRIGDLISGVRGPYSYLPDSVQSFPTPDRLIEELGKAGFVAMEHRLFTGGIAVLLLARAGGEQTPARP